MPPDSVPTLTATDLKHLAAALRDTAPPPGVFFEALYARIRRSLSEEEKS